MRWLGFISASLALLGLFTGCSAEQTGKVVDAMTKSPYVDRAEKEIYDWFDEQNLVIIDDTKMGVAGVINGKPTVLLLNSHVVNGTPHQNVLCITQHNALPSTPLPAKYAALVVIKVLSNPNLFEAGEIEPVSCNPNDSPELRYMTANVAFGRSLSVIEQAFRDAVNEWLQKDIVATLKSTSNIDGLEGLSNPLPRNQAQNRGIKYAVIEDTGLPIVRSISFVAE